MRQLASIGVDEQSEKPGLRPNGERKLANTSKKARTKAGCSPPRLWPRLRARTVRVGEHHLHLTSLEQSLLYLLAVNAGRVLTREEILAALWGLTT